MIVRNLSRRTAIRVLFAAALLFPAAAFAAEATVKLRLMGTTDIHVHVLNYDYYRGREDHGFGLSKTASLIRRARAEVPNSLLIDNGDVIQGNPMGDYMAREKGLRDGDVHPVYKAMNLLGYDVGNIGNHEFNYGLEYLAIALKGATFPYVNANVMTADGRRNMFTPYLILERKLVDTVGRAHPIRIGVIGFVPPQIMVWDRVHLEGKVTVEGIVETARRLVPEMKAKGADLVIAVPHSGLGPVESAGSEENVAWLLSRVPGIDAILLGHAHLLFPSDDHRAVPGVDVAKGTINGVAAVMPGFWGSHLGLIDLTLSVDDAGKWRVVDRRSELRPVFRMQDLRRVPVVANDPAVVAAVRHDHEATLAFLRKPVAETAARIHSYFALVRDDPSIQIVTDAQKWYVERLLRGTEYGNLPVLSAGAPFKAGSRGGPDYYTDIPAGPLAIRHVADLYLYPNTVQVVRVTGAQVKEWLEMSAGIFNRIDPTSREPQPLLNPAFPPYNFDVIDGVTYRIDVTRPRRYDGAGRLTAPGSHRIVDLAYDGKPIDPAMVFAVATNNHRASGGGRFPALDGKTVIVEAPDENRTVIIDYLFERGRIDPSADGNWSFAKPARPVTVTFESSPAAEALLSSLEGVSVLGPGSDGFVLYALELE